MSTDILPVAGPATHLAPPPGGRWTVAEYAGLPDDGLRYEIVYGELRITATTGARSAMPTPPPGCASIGSPTRPAVASSY
jgi:hypothetical protein